MSAKRIMPLLFAAAVVALTVAMTAFAEDAPSEAYDRCADAPLHFA